MSVLKMVGNESFVNVSLNVPRSIWGRVKQLATERNCKIEVVVADLLTEILTKKSGMRHE